MTPTAFATGGAATPLRREEGSVSPDNAYRVECGQTLKLHQVSDGALLSEAGVRVQNCQYDVVWPSQAAAESDLRFAFLSEEGQVYVGFVDGSIPRLVYSPATPNENVRPTMSPEGDRLVIAGPETEYMMKLVVIDLDDFTQKSFWVDKVSYTEQVGEETYNAASPTHLQWFTNDVLELFNSKYGVNYYYIGTGRLLLSQGVYGGTFPWPWSLSPDERWWVVSDRGYVLHDLERGRSYLLSNMEENYLEFAGWDMEKSELYVVSRPANAFAVSDRNTPFGLLAINLQSRQPRMLFAQAVEVVFRPDKQWALVAFPGRDEDGRLELLAGLYEVGTSRLVGRQIIADEVIYGPPVGEFGWSDGEWNGLIYAKWSQDGRTVQFSVPGVEEGWNLEVPEP